MNKPRPRQLTSYVSASVIGTGANFITRFFLSSYVGFALSMVLSTYIGMIIIFFISYHKIFSKELPAWVAFIRFTIVAHIGLLSVVLFGTMAHNILISFLEFPQTSIIDGTSHAIGIITGFFINFIGHSYFSFSTTIIPSPRKQRGPYGYH